VAPGRHLQRGPRAGREQYLKKGSKIFVEGQLQTRKWTDQAGVEKYVTEVVLQRYRGEIVMLGGGAPSGEAGPAERQESSGGGFGQGAATGRRIDDDEIPF
jgi:single-strand DNA-binding protein